METSRRKFIGATFAFAVAAGCAGPRCGNAKTTRPFSLDGLCTLRMPFAGLKEPVTFFVLGDTHFNLHDERDDAYADNYKRMARMSAPKDVLAKTMKRARDAKGDPVALFMHIPLWLEGWNITTCGHPEWGAATDPYWQIERRERWAERLMPSTYEFREAVLDTPNLVGVFTGHKHKLMVAQAGRALFFSVPMHREGRHMEVRLSPM